MEGRVRTDSEDIEDLMYSVFEVQRAWETEDIEKLENLRDNISEKVSSIIGMLKEDSDETV